MKGRRKAGLATNQVGTDSDLHHQADARIHQQGDVFEKHTKSGAA